jgi:hypothetical protein
MSEAKYKVGQEMASPRFAGPRKITAVRHFYQLEPTDVLWGEDELTPYVRPLAVGDRVRAYASGCQGVIIATHKNEFWVDRGERYGCVTYHADELERIPTEEAGK